MSQPLHALHVLLIQKLNYKLLSKTVCVSESLCMNKFNLTHTENKSLFHVRLEGSK